MSSPINNRDIISSSSLHSLSLPSIESIGTESLQKIKQSLSHLSKSELKLWADSKNESGKTALAIAVESHSPTSNKMDIITFLITECNADPNLGDKDNWTPLYRAATGTRSDALEFLLRNKADNIKNADGSTPLHRLVDRGNENDVQILLNLGADVNALNCFGTPLAYAAKNGNISIAKKLLDSGADPNFINDPLSMTPVELAANNRKEDMKQFLISKNGQKTIPLDSKVHTTLSRLVFEGTQKDAILQSFMKGEKDEYGRTVLHYCAHLGMIDLIKEMNGHLMDMPDNKGRIALHYAVMRGHQSCVEYLISDQGNCALDSRDHQGYGALMWACQYNQHSIAQSILKRAKEKNVLNTVLDISDHFGWKAIHKAAQVGNLELVRMFVEEYQVNPNVVTTNGRTPLELAKGTNAVEVMNYLSGLTTSIPEGMSKI